MVAPGSNNSGHDPRDAAQRRAGARVAPYILRRLGGRVGPDVLGREVTWALMALLALVVLFAGVKDEIGPHASAPLSAAIYALGALTSVFFLTALVANIARGGARWSRSRFKASLWVLGFAGGPLAALAYATVGPTYPLPGWRPNSVAYHDGVLEVSGEVSPDMARAVRAALEANGGDVRVLTISSGGGSVFSARQMAAQIVEHGLITQVSDYCASACVNIFAAGRERFAGYHALFGCHRGALRGLVDGEIGRELPSGVGELLAAPSVAGQRARIADAIDAGSVPAPPQGQDGSPQAEVDMIAERLAATCDRTPSRTIHHPDRALLSYAGLITHVETAPGSDDFRSVLDGDRAGAAAFGDPGEVRARIERWLAEARRRARER